MNQRQPAAPPPVLSGSWQDVFNQAQQKAANFNDEAIPLYYKVFNGLGRLPKSRRNANNDKLQDLFAHSAMALQGYLNLRDRYDESLEVLAQARNEMEPDEQDQWNGQIIDVLIQAGRVDEGLERLYALARQDDAELGDWARLVMALLRVDRPQEALAALDEAEKALADATSAGADQELAGGTGQEADNEPDHDAAHDADIAEARDRELAYLLGLRSLTAIEAGEWEQGVALFDEVVARQGAYANSPHLFYSRLINAGRYDDALPLLDRDRARPIRSGFWRGLSLFKQGRKREAENVWKRVVAVQGENANENSIVEYSLAHFYLGDEDRVALTSLLNLVREQKQRVPWAIFMLIGLGWVVRDDLTAARSNFEIAVAQLKSAAEGPRIAYHFWQMSEGLLDDTFKAALRDYFEADPAGPAA